MSELPQAVDTPYQTVEVRQNEVEQPKTPEHLIAKTRSETCDRVAEIKEETDKLVKVDNLFKKLESKYPDFERCNFKMNLSPLPQEDVDYLGHESLFHLYSHEGNPIGYLDQDGAFVLSFKDFNPYVDDFGKSLFNSRGIYFYEENGVWTIEKKGKEKFSFGDLKFDKYLRAKYLKKKD